VIVIGHDERIVLINASAISVLRLYPDQRYMGLKISEVLEDSPVLASFRKASTNAQVLTDQITFHPDRPYSVTVTPHVDIGWIIVMHDLTAVRRADQLKHDFISVLSHDLKQPIGVVKGYVELMEMNYPDLNERAKRYIAMIYQSLENMSKLIEDMLDLARLDSDIEITNGKVSIQNLILAVIEWIRPGAETKSMTIESNIPKELPPLLGDETRLIQLFVNLVHNAVKYTPPGGHVAILAEQIGDSIQVRVKDNGIGISPDDQKAIFARFFRVRRPETENIEGSGVGLTLVKKLVDLHKGQIGLESRLGEGTTFYVTLPIWND
jgi:two-component system phosphate regulon sensor histidine kinase PhoR